MPKRGPSTVEERIHRIVGQLNGVEKMIENDKPLDQVISQIKAISSSLDSVKIALVKKQVRKQLQENLDQAVKLLK